MASNGRRKAPAGGGIPVSRSTSSLPPPSQCLPQLLASLQPSDTANANGNVGTFSAATAKCRGEFCRVAPAALRGVYGERVENNDTGDDEDDATETPQRRLLRDRNIVLPDDGQRFKIGNNNLLLARAEMAFLMGKMGNGMEPEELVLQWQEADNLNRTELGRSNPSAFYKQVAVCRNCHRIYADVASFREQGFRWNAKKTAWDGDQSKERHGAKKHRTGGGEDRKRRTEKTASGSPEDDTSLYYDRMFLAELAKHGETEATETSARRESDVPVFGEKKQPPRATAGEPVLPTLGVGIKANPEKTKKLRPTAEEVLSARQSSNQQQVVDAAASLLQLEKVVGRLREELGTEQAKSKSAEAQRQLLEQKLTQNQALMQDREDEFRKRILEVELESMEKKRSTGGASDVKSGAAADMGDLIESIESLHQQLDEANHEKDKLRRELVHNHQIDVKRLHERYQVEMETLRLSEHTAKEQAEAASMQMTHWQSEAQVAISQAKSCRTSLDELTKSKLPLLEEKNQRLERQLAELKAKASTSNSATAGTNGSSSSQDIAAIEKHLNNKVEYLKAQLASEMKCKEELGSHLASITASLEALKKEKRVALADQEEAHKRHLERVEANFAQEKDVMCSQQATMQGKIATLQANVTDLVQELTMSKSKETNTKLALEKMAEENVRLTRQIVDMEGLIEGLQEERKRDGLMSAKNASEETQRMQMEALLRRLDNERQYLKNQVDNEAELKAQSQRQAQTLEIELRELKMTTEEITKLAEHEISALQAEKSNLERQLRDEKAALEESKLHLSRQLKDVQVKFMQTREQSLLEKDELEKARIEVNEARSQLIAAREEVMKEKEYSKTASDRMSKALTTIKASYKSMEEEKNMRIQRLDDEIAMYMQKLAKSQGDLLVLENKSSEDKRSFKRQQALARMFCVVNRNLEGRHLACKAAAFWRMHLANSVAATRDTLIAAHQVELAELENRSRRYFMDKCDEMTQALHAEREEALQRLKAVHEHDKDELKQYYEQEKSQLEEDLRHLHGRQMQEFEEQYEHTIKSVDEQSAAALSALQQRCEELHQERDEARSSFDETRRRCEEFGARIEACERSAAAEIKEKERRWLEERQTIVDGYDSRLEELSRDVELREKELLDDQETKLRECIDAAESRHKEAVVKLRAEFESIISQKELDLVETHQAEFKQLQEQHAIELDEEKMQIGQSWQKELERERVAHEKKLKEALDRVETKTQGHLESMQKDMNDRKANALLQTTAKWQKAMEELQSRLEIEKKVAYENGLQDRENEWQQAALLIKQKQKEELDSVQKEAVRAIQAAEERHKVLLQAQLAQMRKEFEEKHALDLEKLRNEIEHAEKTKNVTELAAALKNQEEDLTRRHNEEIENIREELTDDHRADMASLEEKFANEMKMLADNQDREQQDLLRRMGDEHAQKLDALTKENESHCVSALNQQRAKLLDEFDASRQEMQDVFDAELSDKLKEQEERLLNEQEDAINQVQEDSEKLIEQVEVAMTELKKQKEGLENELSRLRNALEAAEDAHFDVEENLKKQQKSMVFQLMVLIMHAKKTLEDAKSSHIQQLLELQAKHDQVDNTLQREKKQWERDLGKIRETWTQVQSRHGDMLQTLTNYKRDELVAHRSASSVLSNEITIVTKQMEEVTEVKTTLEKEIEQLQHEAHSVESSLRQLMMQGSSSSSSSLSSGGDGSLNMATVAKKRRLNEEFDALLEQAERKKAEVRNIDKTLASLRQRREEKESELKSMERKLVEILVGQQKQMLTLLNATREVAQLPAPLAASVSTG